MNFELGTHDANFGFDEVRVARLAGKSGYARLDEKRSASVSTHENNALYGSSTWTTDCKDEGNTLKPHLPEKTVVVWKIS